MSILVAFAPVTLTVNRLSI